MSGSDTTRLGLHDDERGALLEIIALSLVFIVLLGIAWSIDNPTTQAASAKAQHAADIGVVHGVGSFHSYENAARAALGNAIAVMSNNYGPGGIGRFSDDFTGNPTLRVAIPRFQRPGNNNGGANGGAAIFTYDYLTGGVFPSTAELDQGDSRNIYASVIDPMLNGFRINDFKNAVFFYARVTPNRFLRVVPRLGLNLSLGQVEVASLAMLKTVMSYVLIDPAFSMEGDAGGGNLNLAHILPPEAGNTPDPGVDWPTRGGLRYAGGDFGALDPNDFFPASGLDAFQSTPLNGTPLSGLTPAQQENIYRAHAALCDTLPFAFFKETAVNLLDWFTGSSAFNHTTLVGLTGYARSDHRISLPLLALFPNSTTRVAPRERSESHLFDPTGFPLPRLAVSERHNRGLHEPRTPSLRGYVNTKELAGDANVGDGASATTAGVNDWSLCYCRQLYRAAGGSFGDFQLAEDRTWFAHDEPQIHHYLPALRVRDAVNGNWCDDFVAPGGARDVTVNYNYARNGAGSETVRNIVAGLGIRVNNINSSLQALESDPATWSYPGVSSAFNGSGALETGYRDLPAALAQIGPSGVAEPCAKGSSFSNHPQFCGALNYLLQASNDYQSDNALGVARPIGKRVIVVLGFGLWSRSAYEIEKAKRGGALLLETYESERVEAFRAALSEAVCRYRVGVHLAFLPLDNWDRNTVIRAQEVAKDFETLYRYQQEGGGAPTPPGGCAIDNPVAPVWFAMVDHETFPGTDDATRKLQAAAFFRKTIVSNITQALLEWQFPL